MAARSTEGRHGLTPFRLSDIPHTVRRQVGERLITIARDSMQLTAAMDVERAIEFPSERVYWIPTEVWETEAARPRWRKARR